jgi:hypothetical protein
MAVLAVPAKSREFVMMLPDEISAGELRAMGLKIDSSIPDCAVAPRSGLIVGEVDLDTDEGVTSLGMNMTFTGKFTWVSATIKATKRKKMTPSELFDYLKNQPLATMPALDPEHYDLVVQERNFLAFNASEAMNRAKSKVLSLLGQLIDMPDLPYEHFRNIVGVVFTVDKDTIVRDDALSVSNKLLKYYTDLAVENQLSGMYFVLQVHR